MWVVLIVRWFCWDCILGCNWHIQISLMYSAFCARNGIEYFGSTSVLTSSSYWNCNFSMTETNIRNMKSKVINWQCLCNPITSLAMYVCSSVMMMHPHGTRWYACVLVWWWGFLGNRSAGSNLPELFIQPQPNYCSHLTDCRKDLWSEWAALQAGSRAWIHEHASCRTNGKLFQKAMYEIVVADCVECFW